MKFFSKIVHTNLEKEASLINKYSPIKVVGDNNFPQDFRTKDIELEDSNIEILLQNSYDDSVNMLINDGVHDIRIINSGFAKIGNTVRQTVHNGVDPTNRYDESYMDSETKLFIYPRIYPTIDLQNVSTGGQLKCGNYVFYLKYIDDDGNTTDFICESGIISIFNGDHTNISSIHGGLLDERTDKQIELSISNVDPKFTKLELWVSRTTSDMNGVSVDYVYKYTEPIIIKLTDGKFNFSINGLEEFVEVSNVDLNIQTNFYSSAKSITSTQNTLFIGNISTTVEYDVLKLSEISKSITTTCVQNDSVGFVQDTYKDISGVKTPGEYYNPINIYYKLGYWPNELYRFGVVYIFKNGERSQVFSLKGGIVDQQLTSTNKQNEWGVSTTTDLMSEYGIFQTPDATIINYGTKMHTSNVKPLAFKFQLNRNLINELENLGVTAYYFVRQPRIPNVIAQGLSIGVNRYHGFPMPFVTCAENNFDQQQKLDLSDNTKSKFGFIELNGSTFNEYAIIQGNYFIVESIFGHWWEFNGDSGKDSRGGWVSGHYDYQLNYDQGFERKMLPIVSAHKDLSNWWMASKYLEDNKDHASECRRIDWPHCTIRNDSGDFKSAIVNSMLTSSTYGGLICTDVYCIPELQSLLTGQKFYITLDTEYWQESTAWPTNWATWHNMWFHNRYIPNNITSLCLPNRTTTSKILNARKIHDTKVQPVELLYIPEKFNQTVYKSATVNGKEKPVFYKYCTTIGSAEDINTTVNAFLDIENPNFRQRIAKHKASWDMTDFVRGNFTPFIGVMTENPSAAEFKVPYEGTTFTTYFPYTYIKPSCIYDICVYDKTDAHSWITAVSQYNEPYYSCSNIKNLQDPSTTIVYRGDCFTNTVSTRMQWGFIDPSVPLQDDFVDPLNVANFNGSSKYQKNPNNSAVFNRGDFNAVKLGYWITYKSLSNYNVGLRSEDRNNPEYASLGNYRSFYPHRGPDRNAWNKMPDSSILNLGYSRGRSFMKHFLQESLPFVKTNYANRIAFSNTSMNSAFQNNWRVFQGLQYQDIDTEYGVIVKLMDFLGNLFVVFEHGIGILGVNSKVLLSTDSGAEVHISGAGVLDDKVRVISGYYGSQHKESIIRTPNGFYGVDALSNKIWKFNSDGFIIISDRCIEKVLNNILSQSNITIKTHYNHYKNDVMFVIKTSKETWNICYNEITGTFTTFYTWYPELSTNINNSFHSFGSSNTLYEHFSGDVTKQINPTTWYDKTYPFEFEFVVNNPAGLQKIFDNLSIISNSVEPESLEISLIGDSYILKNVNSTTYPIIKINNNVAYAVTTHLDEWENSKLLKVFQKSLNIRDFGRRLGNIEYKEDAWYISLQPINLKLDGVLSQQKIRDKWIKVRIKYSGNDLALITAISTSFRLSYA